MAKLYSLFVWQVTSSGEIQSIAELPDTVLDPGSSLVLAVRPHLNTFVIHGSRAVAGVQKVASAWAAELVEKESSPCRQTYPCSISEPVGVNPEPTVNEKPLDSEHLPSLLRYIRKGDTTNPVLQEVLDALEKLTEPASAQQSANERSFPSTLSSSSIASRVTAQDGEMMQQPLLESHKSYSMPASLRKMKSGLTAAQRCWKSTVTSNELKLDSLATLGLDILNFEPDVISEICPFLLMGGIGVARDLTLLRSHGVSHVVNISGVRCHELEKSFPGQNRRHYMAMDSVTQDLTQFIVDATNFIDLTRVQGGVCLVFCRRGISRSATLVMAYLILRENLTCSQALARVRSSRNIADPNFGFIDQLEALVSWRDSRMKGVRVFEVQVEDTTKLEADWVGRAPLRLMRVARPGEIDRNDAHCYLLERSTQIDVILGDAFDNRESEAVTTVAKSFKKFHDTLLTAKNIESSCTVSVQRGWSEDAIHALEHSP